MIFLIGFLLFVFSACHSPDKDPVKLSISNDQRIFSPRLYSEMSLDSDRLFHWLEKDSSLQGFREDILSFYRNRDFQFAWIHEGRAGNEANDLLHRAGSYVSLFNDSSLQLGKLIIWSDSLASDSTYLLRNPDLQQEMEILYTITFFKYVKIEYYGWSEKAKSLDWYIPPRKKDYLKMLEMSLSSDHKFRAQEPGSRMYRRLRESLGSYREIQQRGGWPRISAPEEISTDSMRLNLLTYLKLSGDLQSGAGIDSLEDGLKNFQRRMGLNPSGFPDLPTIRQMNVSVEERIRQIMINLERLRWMPDSLPSYYLLVNIPDYHLYLVDSGKLKWKMRVVVGKEATSTSIFSASLSRVVFAPYWNVPRSIAVNEILPSLKRDRRYLERNHMELLRNGKPVNAHHINWRQYHRNFPFEIRQKPGPWNALGRVKFLFPNEFHIYLHDTPAKALFDREKRAFSHGCIRMAEAGKLANELLIPYRYKTQQLDSLMNLKEETTVVLKKPVPVFIGYFTSWVDAAGRIQFREDIYGLDARLSREVFGK